MSSESNPIPPGLAGNLWKVDLVRALFWTHFISSVLIPFYRDWGGLSLQQILLVNAWFMVWNFLLEIPTGTVADVWGRRVSLVAGCVLGIVGALTYISAPSLPRFLVAEIFFAASFTLMSGADEALLHDSLAGLGRTGEANARFARLASFQQVGIVVGALLGSVIFTFLGPRAPLGLQTVPMAVAALVALTIVEPSRTLTTERPAFRSVLTVGVRTFLGSPPLQRLALHMTLFGAVAWIVIWTYQPLIERAGIPVVAFGLVHTGMSLAQIAFFAGVGRLERRLGSRKALLLAGPLVTGLAFLGLTLTRQPVAVVGWILVVAAFGLTRPPLFSGHLNQHIHDSRQRATVLSTVSMLRTVAIAGGNVVAGVLANRSLDSTLTGLAVASLLLLLLPLRPGDLETSTAPPPDQGMS